MAASRSIRPVEAVDLGQLFTLQRAAFVDEARLYNTPFVPALDDTFDEFKQRLAESTSWVALQDDRIVGAVSLRSYRGAPDIERLMVAPDCRGQGIASVLMQMAEDHARSAGHTSLRLIVGDLATDNQAIYSHLGWTRTSSHQLEGFADVLLHTMTKTLA